MNEQLENSENDFLWKLLANPADPSHSYVYNLQLVVNDHPQSGILRALLVPKGDDQHLRHAAAYFTPGTLYKMATNLDALPAVSDSQIVFVEESTYVPRTYVNPMAEPFIPPIVDDSDTNYFHVEEADAPAVVEQDEPAETPEAYIENEPQAAEEAPAPPDEPEHVEDEVYDEITPHDETPISINPPVADAIVEEQAEEESNGTTEYPWYIDQQEETAVEKKTEDEPVATTESEYPWYIDQSAEETEAAALSQEDIEEEEETNEEEILADENLLAKEYEEHLASVNAANAHIPYYTFNEDDEEESISQEVHDHIDEDVYDEIVSIEDIGLEQIAILDKVAKDEAVIMPSIDTQPEAQEETEQDEAYTEAQPEAVEVVAEAREEQAIEEERAQQEETAEEEVTTASYQQQPVSVAMPAIAATSSKTPRGDAFETVSRYNDEKMPYSFMWWLDKTRKEHADVYQPYTTETNPVKPPAAKQETSDAQTVKPILADELQQQYFENIFNANSIHGLDPLPAQPAAPEPAVRKEDKIIERFIQEEPQIKHPSTVKLNSENKAKKSSEDRDELVTETLAKIYTEQMLYHKAIGTYKKLMLKYPEKSLYFAGQIEQLENKIN